MTEEPRWRRHLEKELRERPAFDAMDEISWKALLDRTQLTSHNRDTVVSLDWPHYCSGATESCGGPKGWCYTFQGHQASLRHNRKVALVDSLARRYPELFADTVAQEVQQQVAAGRLPYPNLRYSGSGEIALAHVPALRRLMDSGVWLWGFTRNLEVAAALRQAGAAVIVSVDAAAPSALLEAAQNDRFPVAYSSASAADVPHFETFVTFPIHRNGKVREVPAVTNLCPKVLQDFFEERRNEGTCQRECRRCHLRG